MDGMNGGGNGNGSRPVVRVEELRHNYPDGTSSLRGLTLSVKQSERVALLGENGAGKSTLLLHLNGILQGDGVVEVGELSVKKNLREVRQRVGLLFQNPDDQLFSPTVFDDVAFGLVQAGVKREEIQQKVQAALESVGMEGLESRTPFHLSLGQKKRVALAAVLALDPDILVLDEPTGGLDPRGRRELIELLEALDRTMILATHDLDMVRELCGRAVVVADGTVVAEGTPQEILENDELLASAGLA